MKKRNLPNIPEYLWRLPNSCGLLAMKALGLYADGNGWHEKNGMALTALLRNIRKQARTIELGDRIKTVRAFGQKYRHGRYLILVKNHVGVIYHGYRCQLSPRDKIKRSWQITKKRKK